MEAGDLEQLDGKNASINKPGNLSDSDTVNDTRGAQPNERAEDSQHETVDKPMPHGEFVEESDEDSNKEYYGHLFEEPYKWSTREDTWRSLRMMEDDKDKEQAESAPETQTRDVMIGVRFYDTRGFYNRTVNDAGDFTIEALVGSPNAIDTGSKMEFARRKRIDPRTDGTAGDSARDLRLDGGVLLQDDLNHKASGPQASLQANKPGQLSMVRIRSATIVGAIVDLQGYSRMPLDRLNGRLFLFPRPFTSFYHCQDNMKQRLAELQSRLEEAESEPNGSETVSLKPGKESSEQAVNKRAVKELQLCIDFVDSYIMPLWKQFDEVNHKTPRSISYDDIPLLFRAGDLAYVPPEVDIRIIPNSGIQTVFKMVHSLRHNCRFKGNIVWSIYCLDYREGKYIPVWREIQFPHFDGLANINELPCYPLKFHPDCKGLLAQQIKGGEKFRKCVEAGNRDIYYSGWTLVTGILPRSHQGRQPEHVESEVIVDFKESLSEVSWALLENESSFKNRRSFGDDTYDVVLPNYRIWREPGYPVYHAISESLFSRVDAKCHKVWQDTSKQDRFLTNNGDITGADFTDKHLAILPKRVPGYILRERKFAILHVMNFETSRETANASLDAVQMPPGHKRMIRSAVAAHFQKRHRERRDRTTIHGVDLVRGKGNGLVILLHGPPGTGKTLTAEAVAAENNKPLFPIACGDLGFTPDKVEQSLKEIFRYAHLWDCILLLDEADVFLTRRNVTDIQRNALVSVFLRVVEYYNGILFLTTNRVGAIDEAFRSRIHISLNYKHLDCADTMAILDTHLKRLPRRNPKSAPHGNDGDDSGGTVLSGGAEEKGMLVMDREIREYIRQEWQSYAKKHKRERGPWNGRQIRNAVYVATSLAIYENQLDNSRGAGDGDGAGEGGRGSSTDPVVLTAAHFQTVGDSTREFDDYMKRVRRADADTMARMAGERDDFYDDETYEMARFEGFSGPAVHHSQRHLDQHYPPAGHDNAGSKRGAQSRRGNLGRGAQRSYYGAADGDALQQQRFPRDPREEYSVHGPTQRERGRIQIPSQFQSHNKASRDMWSSRGATSRRHHDEDEGEDIPAPEFGDGDDGDNEQWEEDSFAYREKSLHHRATNQNRGYAWGRGEGSG